MHGDRVTQDRGAKAGPFRESGIIRGGQRLSWVAALDSKSGIAKENVIALGNLRVYVTAETGSHGTEE